MAAGSEILNPLTVAFLLCQSRHHFRNPAFSNIRQIAGKDLLRLKSKLGVCDTVSHRMLPLKLRQLRHHPEPANQAQQAHRGGDYETVGEMPRPLNDEASERRRHDSRQIT